MNQEKIGKFILELRKQHNLTQKEFADKLNVTAQAVSKWENGRGIPDIEMIHKISTEFHVEIDNIINGTKEKKNKKKNIILIIVSFLIFILILLGIVLYTMNQEDYSFTDVTSTSKKFNVSGVAAYSKDKNSIYISNIEYLEKEKEEKYVSMECILYESHDNLEEKVSQCGSLKEKNTPQTLTELLKDTEFKVENFSCTKNNIKNSNLYISINAKDENNNITTYKIPLQLTGSCN